jgi:hypothetical protein
MTPVLPTLHCGALSNFIRIGQTINWTNYGTGNKLLQSGSFVYDGGLITLYKVKIKRPTR